MEVSRLSGLKVDRESKAELKINKSLQAQHELSEEKKRVEKSLKEAHQIQRQQSEAQPYPYWLPTLSILVTEDALFRSAA